jgi:hypothetical protein
MPSFLLRLMSANGPVGQAYAEEDGRAHQSSIKTIIVGSPDRAQHYRAFHRNQTNCPLAGGVDPFLLSALRLYANEERQLRD